MEKHLIKNKEQLMEIAKENHEDYSYIDLPESYPCVLILHEEISKQDNTLHWFYVYPNDFNSTLNEKEGEKEETENTFIHPNGKLYEIIPNLGCIGCAFEHNETDCKLVPISCICKIFKEVI